MHPSTAFITTYGLAFFAMNLLASIGLLISVGSPDQLGSNGLGTAAIACTLSHLTGVWLSKREAPAVPNHSSNHLLSRSDLVCLKTANALALMFWTAQSACAPLTVFGLATLSA